jgi:peptide chain release factor 2
MQSLLKRKSSIEDLLKEYNEIDKNYEDLKVILELYQETGEEIEGIEGKINEINEEINKFELKLLLKEENDANNAILILHAGTGGTDAQDWTEMLARMYIRWCEKRGFKIKVIDKIAGDEAGIKGITLHIIGKYAYGMLKCEIGIHRLVRISPFDTNKRRHTSFASVFVYPELDESIEIKIEEKDLKIDTYRAGGPGGQHVNVTDSAVRITHIPTGIVVQCQNERSQHRNKEIAMKILKSRLYEYYRQQQLEKTKSLESAKKDITWGNQIRSYILHPYKLVKDHRTKLEKHNVDEVLDGEINDFIKAYLIEKSKTPLEKL